MSKTIFCLECVRPVAAFPFFSDRIAFFFFGENTKAVTGHRTPNRHTRRLLRPAQRFHVRQQVGQFAIVRSVQQAGGHQ